jgi:pyruvate-formate lyase-activating enzyme
LDLAISYELLVTYIEKKDCVTAYHGAELCNCCGKCVTDIRPESCPNQADSTQIILSPQGWGPARNIIGFTGGDLLCCPEFYVKCTKLIKKETNLYVLLETNGLGLTPAHLTMLKRAGVDSFWLDMKAFDDKTHIKLTGASNQHILQLPQLIKEMGFCLEVLSLYIPDWVETEQIQKIAALLVDVDPAIPFTILAYFPAHKMTVRSPRLDEMISAYDAAKEAGLHNVKMGNLGVLSKE